MVKSTTAISYKSSTFAAKKIHMKQQPKHTIEEVVCNNVLQLLQQRNISIRKLADCLNKDHSNLNKILRREATLPAYIIDDFATFFGVSRITLVTEKQIDYQTDDNHNTIHLTIHIPSFNIYKQVVKFIDPILK